MRGRLIIVADDFGMCDSVNAGIRDCLGAGAVRSTCVMVNMPAWQAAASLPHNYLGVSLGLHWTLTLGRPILPQKHVKSLIDVRGRFASFAELRRRVMTGHLDMEEMEAELRAQHTRFCDAIGRPHFWNTHENMHLFPRLFIRFVRLALELRIPAMRSNRRITIRKNGASAAYCVRHPLYWLKGGIISSWAQRAESMGSMMPDGSINPVGFGAGKASVNQIAPRIPWELAPRAAELVVHPATSVNRDLFGRVTESRLAEHRAFSDPSLACRLRLAGIEPAGFDMLSNVS